MKAFHRKLEEVLAEKFGVSRDFTAHLAPLLECYGRQRPSAREWEALLASVAAAYHSRSEEFESIDETRILIRQFVSELKAMDESIKVLGVYLERVRQSLQHSPSSRTIH